MLGDFAAHALCALRAIAAVHPTVCSPSVTLRYCGHISWATSKIIRLHYGLRSWAPQRCRASLRGTPKKFGFNRGGVLFSAENLHTKQEIGPRLLLTTNRKPHARFRLLPKSATLDDLERPLCTLFQNTCVFGAHRENLN